MIRIVVYGSNSLLLAGLVSILDFQPELQVVGSFSSGINPISFEDFSADLLLLERSPDSDWQLEQWMSESLVGILLTDTLTTEEMGEYLTLGFKGFLPRLSDTEEIIAAIKAVMAGLIVIHPELASFDEPQPAIAPFPDIPLTAREIQILQLLKTGLDNKAIANQLQISKHTVKFHISSILSKLNVSSRTEAVMLGLRQGIINL
jgi:two-component system, NarL family, response regulator YdfI